jgi:hypothetical protein
MRWRSMIGEFGSITGELITSMGGKSKQLYCDISGRSSDRNVIPHL